MVLSLKTCSSFSLALWCQSWFALLSSSVHRRDPAGRWRVGEGEPGGLFLSVLWGEHQCTICPHRDRSHHHYFWTVRLLCYMPRQPMDAQTGQCWCGKAPWIIPFRFDLVIRFSFHWSLQYAMFLTLVFLAELVAGVSGFIFRHEVSNLSKTFFTVNQLHQPSKIFNLLCFEFTRSRPSWALPIKKLCCPTITQTAAAAVQWTPSRGL